METDRIVKRWKLICGEIQHRWPDLRLAELNVEKMPNQLEIVLASHYGLAQARAIREANQFWDELQHKLQQAAA